MGDRYQIKAPSKLIFPFLPSEVIIKQNQTLFGIILITTHKKKETFEVKLL